MQSTQETMIQVDADPAENRANGDNNANVLNGANTNPESRGAIPKIRTVKPKANKVIKWNNNIEGIPDCDYMKLIPEQESLPEKLLTNGSSSSNDSQTLDPLVDSLTCFILNNDKDEGHSEEDELLSISDDGCIYTYKGDQDADLPVSFFNLDLPREPSPADIRKLNYSPEMDYLEMDFEPEPSCDGEFESKDVENSDKTENEVTDLQDVCGACSSDFTVPEVKIEEEKTIEKEVKTVIEIVPTLAEITEEILEDKDDEKTLDNKDMPWSCPVNERTVAVKGQFILKKYHFTTGELVNPNQSQPSSPLSETQSQKPNSEDAMIWSPYEGTLKQLTQIGPSACGATAIVNALNALKFPISVQKIQQNINTKLRKHSAPLTEYLLSRSEAGTTHQDLIDCIHKVSDGKIYARFFHMFPERIVNLKSFLKFWIDSGGVPIATLNIQQAKKGTQNIPDAWHHQMIFGVNEEGIHFTNPIECTPEDLVWPQLTSESVLLIRRQDVLSRWNIETDMPDLMGIDDERWRSMNVVGQVAHIVYQSRRELKNGFKNTPHIRIPAAYSSGITIAIPVSSPAYNLLQQCPELPVYDKPRNPYNPAARRKYNFQLEQ